MKIRNLAQLLILITSIPGLVPASYAASSLIFTAPPRETPAAARKLYGPLAKKLSQLVGRKVVYKYPGLYIGDWGTYSHHMQQGKYAFVFDGPQFVSWRMKYLHDIPLVSLPGHLGYLVATDNPDVKSMKNLIGNRVCGIDSPNLLTLSFLSKFSDPVQQPVIIAIDSGGMPAIHRAQLAGKCHTAIYRDSYFEHHLSASERSKLRVIYRSPRNMPNQTITASPSISPAARQRIIAALTNPKHAKAASGIFTRFAKGATHFVAANPADFKGLYKLLTPLGSISGWVPGS
ncbi:phosphate/phosphite/phosphonate ABC transporter substrate-binding protein [Acidihalobacter prosperus]